MSLRYPSRKRHVRLTMAERRTVRGIYLGSPISQRMIARVYNVTQPTISNIVRSA